MPSKPFPLKCATCRERAVAPTVLPTYFAKMEHEGHSYKIELKDLEVLRCEFCKTIILQDAAIQRVTAALVEAAGLLSPAEIRSQREKLGLSQKELADNLRVAEGIPARWESGGQIQQRCMDNFLRFFFRHSSSRRPPNSPPQRRRQSRARHQVEIP